MNIFVEIIHSNGRNCRIWPERNQYELDWIVEQDIGHAYIGVENIKWIYLCVHILTSIAVS